MIIPPTRQATRHRAWLHGVRSSAARAFVRQAPKVCRLLVVFSGYCAGGVSNTPSADPSTDAAIVIEVEAHITGTVWKIECAIGDAIEEGDTVAILESMKMEMPVEAEDAGTVKEILCQEGQAVNEGDTLVVLE